MHDTGAALAGIAADMGAGQVQMIAQEIDKEGTVLDLRRDRLAVHRQFDCRHVETSPCFLIAPIRSTGAGLCNNDFCRDRHCDAVCASTVVPANAGGPQASEQLGSLRYRGFHSRTRPDAVHEVGRLICRLVMAGTSPAMTSALGMRIRGKFTGSYPFCSNFQRQIRELALPVLLILEKTGVRGGIVKARMAAIDTREAPHIAISRQSHARLCCGARDHG